MLAAVVSVAAVPLLSGCSTSVSAASTTVQGALAATIVHSDGNSGPAVDGLRLRPGDVVETGAGGRAELITDDRVVYVGSQAAVQVLDGDHQVLRSGSVVADAQRGPELHTQVAGLQVSIPAGSAVRAERSVTVRVATLVGRADVVSAAGRTLTIRGLYQAMVGGDALPDVTAPLRLTDDDGESHAVPDLVRDDETLNALARGMDSTGPATARVVAASWHGSLAAPVGVGRSERLMPAVIAASGPATGVQQRYDAAAGYRAAGGSWGVVAHLLGLRAGSVVATLAAFERTQPQGRIGSVAAVLAAAGTAVVSSPAGQGSSGVRHTAGHGGNSGGSGGGGGGGGGSGGAPQPSPSPNAPGAVDQVLNTVDQVLSQLPLPTPSPTRTGAPTLPVVPIPLPTVSLPALPKPLP
jgi:uncharacterized membrane protein YgcG